MSPHAAARTRLRRTLLATVACAGAFAAGAPAAFASHLQGGFFTTNVTADGHLKGTLTFLQLRACTAGVGSQMGLPVTITSPNGQSVSKSVASLATVCRAGSSVYSGSFDFPLDTTTFSGGAPDGNYVIKWTASNRIAGIQNIASSDQTSVTLRSQVRKVTGQATAAPYLGSNIATGIAIGERYSQNLNASDADGGTLSYATTLKVRDSDVDAPDSDVVGIDGTGQVTIPASTTSGFTAGQLYVYKTRVTDSQGDYADRDVLMQVAAAGQVTPSVSGLSSQPYTVVPGQTTTIPISASDPSPGNNTVTLSVAGLPSWATFTQTPGNPATGTLTLSPPANLPATSLGINVDATSSANIPLTNSTTIRIDVPAAPETTIGAHPAAVGTADTAHFEFTSDDNAATFECRLDGGAWSACSSPRDLTGVTAGGHTFDVRAIGSNGVTDPTPATWSWTRVVVAAPTAPVRPAGDVSAPHFEFAGDPASTFECAIDGGAFVACASPFDPVLPDGRHTVAVRQVGPLGVPSEPVSYAFTVDTTAPAGPQLLSGPDEAAETTSTSASFGLGAEDGATLECRLDGGAWAPCVAPLTFDGLGLGEHKLELRQTDAAGNVSPTTTRRWTVKAAPAKSADPAPAAFAPAKATTPAPAASPAPVKPARLAAVLGGTVSVVSSRAAVGCKLTGVALSGCKAEIYAIDGDGKRVLIGTGSARAAAGSKSSSTVGITLNAAGRKLVSRAGGAAVTVSIRATTADGRVLKVARATRLLPTHEVVIGQDLLFATRSSVLSHVGAAYLAKLKKRLQGVSSVTCVGHTDSRGSAGDNMRLGFRRAKRVCTTLSGSPKTRAYSSGESRPRVSNATARGRALNRRVVVTLHYSR